MVKIYSWLVLWNILYLSIYWEHGLFFPDINLCLVNPIFTDNLIGFNQTMNGDNDILVVHDYKSTLIWII